MAKTMSPSCITDGQIDKLVGKFRDSLRKHRNKFPRDIAQRALRIDDFGMHLLSPFSEVMSTLGTVRFRNAFSVMLKETRLPSDFFKSRDGLLTTPSSERIASEVSTVNCGTTYKLGCFEIARKHEATNFQIKRSIAYEGKYLFDIQDALAVVAELISDQKNGELGVLHTRGRDNLFYLDHRVLQVFWDSRRKEWHIIIRPPEEREICWDPNTRVFVPR